LNTYGSTIKQIRKSKGLMLKELADDHLSVSLLSQFENNKTTISCERFHLLLEKLEVSYEEFF
jgi:transcriptional regulator with XRE-family HTH domain